MIGPLGPEVDQRNTTLLVHNRCRFFSSLRRKNWCGPDGPAFSPFPAYARACARAWRQSNLIFAGLSGPRISRAPTFRFCNEFDGPNACAIDGPIAVRTWSSEKAWGEPCGRTLWLHHLTTARKRADLDIKFDGAPFLYSWPSKGALSTQDYSYDRESSGQAEPYLRQFLEVVARETGAKSVSVIAHSMGNQLLLPVLRDLKRAAPPSVAISQVILAAPDVDRDGFENIARELVGVSRGVTMLAAGNDRALGISRRFWGGVPRAGDVPAGGPIVIEGVDTIDVTAISTLLFSLNHSGYAETSALLQDIQLLIQTGERPPDKRVPILERVKTDRGDYWRYPRPRP